MKVAEVKKIEFKSKFPELEEISARLDKMNGRLLVDIIKWKGYDYKPQVSLEIAYSDNEIFIKYYITESYFKAEKTETNQMVCEDSCVEFFVSRADVDVVSKIRRQTSVGIKPVKEKKGDVTWNQVGTENPDYHQPKYFGLMKFV
jgi:hypothetical protein